MGVPDVSRDHEMRTDIEVLLDLSYPIGPAAFASRVLHGYQLFNRFPRAALNARVAAGHCGDAEFHAALQQGRRPVFLAL